MNLIYGQTYTASNVNYTLRAPSVGDHHRNEGEGSGLAPIDNEWDTIYQKSADYIKKATFWARPTLPERDIGFRPVLELPTDLAADNLKVVELRTVKFMPGEQQNWINIIVKKGESFKAPSAEGRPRRPFRPSRRTGKRKLLQARRYRSRRCFGTYRFMGRFRSVFGSRRRRGRGYAGQLYRYFRRRDCLLCSA